MILLLDNYDSFVYNLARYVRELGETPVGAPERRPHGRRRRRDGPLPRHHLARPLLALRGRDLDRALVRRLGARIPILGVCLGHQCIGAAYGGEIVRAGQPMHGKTSLIHHRGEGLFRGLPDAVSRHPLPLAGDRPSLRAGRAGGRSPRRRTARSWPSSIAAHPVYGVQFHPESVLTEHGYRLVDHFLHGVPAAPRAVPLAADGALVATTGAEPSTLASNPPPVDLVR